MNFPRVLSKHKHITDFPRTKNAVVWRTWWCFFASDQLSEMVWTSRLLVPIGHWIHHDHIHSWFSSQLWLAYQPLIVRDYIIFYNQKRPYFTWPFLRWKEPWEKMSPARFFAVESGRWLSLGFPEATVTLQTSLVRDTTQVLPSQLLMTTRNPGCKLTQLRER